MDDWLKTAKMGNIDREKIMAGGSLLDDSGDKDFNWNESKEESEVSSSSESSSDGSSGSSSVSSSGSNNGKKTC